MKFRVISSGSNDSGVEQGQHDTCSDSKSRNLGGTEDQWRQLEQTGCHWMQPQIGTLLSANRDFSSSKWRHIFVVMLQVLARRCQILCTYCARATSTAAQSTRRLGDKSKVKLNNAQARPIRFNLIHTDGYDAEFTGYMIRISLVTRVTH